MSKKSVISYMTAAMCSFFAVSCAYAATTNLTASGTVSTVCSFTSTQPGLLAVSPSAPNIINAATSSGGTPAGFAIQYIGTPTVTVLPVTGFDTQPSASVSMTKSMSMTVQSTNEGNVPAAGDGSFVVTESNGSADTFLVEMGATYSSGQSVPVGDYSMATTVTCQ